jgi:hypothetical protein
MRNAPVEYMERTRLYYRALGHEQNYRWAYHGDVSFARLGKPISELRPALITSANQPGQWSEKTTEAPNLVWQDCHCATVSLHAGPSLG